MKTKKTNAMRQLDTLSIPYTHTDLNLKEAADASTVAALLGKPETSVFKTLVALSNDKEHFVFVIPANSHLSLKKAAKAAGKKKIEMIHLKELLPLTGYVHGGCSPFGMKKRFETWFDQSAKDLEDISFSGGKIGVQITLSPADLFDNPSVGFHLADLCEE